MQNMVKHEGKINRILAFQSTMSSSRTVWTAKLVQRQMRYQRTNNWTGFAIQFGWQTGFGEHRIHRRVPNRPHCAAESMTLDLRRNR